VRGSTRHKAMLLDSSASLTTLRARLAGYALDLAGIRLQLLLRKAGFNPDQPRVPAGQPGGGQWTDGGDGGPEYSVRKSAEESYGIPGTVRVDVFENVAERRSVCVYDIKTGLRGSIPAQNGRDRPQRAASLSRHAARDRN
jgi:hypothetical protein